MADDVLKDTIEVKVNDSTYEFTIPSYLDEIRIGVRSRDILRSISTDPTVATMDGLDNQTSILVYTAARFEILLRRSSTQWPWSPGPDGKPLIDFQKWPKDKVLEALSVGMEFGAELASFRSGGTPDTDTLSTQVMESQPISS